ncbi:MAG: peptidoglycan-binding protein [Candidatus Eremiobacteraeota bacterium]|nr:peptidoglycan-binding protein [Candidatus Eremiobacteraeota bacterium]
MAKNWITVKTGRVGPLARTVQYLLNARGYAITVDGDVGSQTTDAIKAFQTDNGLTVDGVVGNQTWPLLIVEVAQGDQGDAVSAAQDQLSFRDLPETRNLTVDGVFGPLTESGVRAFQTYIKDNQAALVDEPVVVDGIVGVNTWYCFVLDLGPLPE